MVTEGMDMQADHKQHNEHECWEKTVTEGMAMQADHKKYSYREITKLRATALLLNLIIFTAGLCWVFP